MHPRHAPSDPSRVARHAAGPGRLVWWSAIVLAAACERKAAPKAPDSVIGSTQSVPVTAASPSAPRVSGWNGEAGTALLVHGESGDALVVVPGAPGDSSTDGALGSTDGVLPTDVALFSRSGMTGHARAELALPAATASGDCVRWPTARLGPAAGTDAVPPWTVGFAGGSPLPLALDSLESAAPADSAGLAAAVTRLASALTDDTVRALRGVPFTVRSARRFDMPDGTQGVVAVLTRALNQEASPIGEHILLVAERPGGAPASAWSEAYHERVAGSEDEVASTEVLAAVALGARRRPTIVLARALSDGNRYSLLERTGPRAWRVRWTSVEGGC